MPSAVAPGNAAVRRFLRVRSGLYVLRYVVLIGVLVLLASFGVLHS